MRDMKNKIIILIALLSTTFIVKGQDYGNLFGDNPTLINSDGTLFGIG